MTIDLDRMPPEMKGQPQWVTWRIEVRDGKPTKVPVNPKTGANAMANDPSTWGQFDQAVRHWEAHKGNGIAGIGFEFSPGDPYTGVDLDKCRNLETGEIDPWALEIVRQLNSYTEISPSGTGLHIILKASVPPGGNRKGHVEMYDSARYFTMTGDHLEDTPGTIEPRQAELDGLHEKIFGKHQKGEPKQGPGKSKRADAGGTVELSDDELIDKMLNATNGPKFKDLWENDWESGWLGHRYKYPSQSEADLALAKILAFWTRKSPGRMDRLFRKSKLMRPKWDEYRGDLTYGQKTIETAIAETKEVWRGAKKRREQNKKPQDTPQNKEEEFKKIVIELNKKHAILMLGGKCAVMNEVIDPVFNRPDVTFSSLYDFKNYYSNRTVTYKADNGEYKKVSITSIWLDSIFRRQYDGIVFSPSNDIPGYYNLFKGFPVEPVKGDWSLYRNLMRNIIAAGNDEHYKYLLKWMARLIKDPGGERSGSAIVMRGKMGVGKGVFVSQYGEILGSHFLHITNPSHLVHRFNNHLKDCLLCFVDEGIWAGDKTAEGILKGMITEKYIMVEPKGKDAFSIKNHIHLIFASNNDWVIPAGLEERRFFVLDVSDKHMQDHEYFAAIINQMNNGGREALLYDLLEMDISDVNLRQIPRTDALFDQIVHTMPTVYKFWFERLRAGILLRDDYRWEEFAVTEDLHRQYLDFALDVGDRYKLTDTQFGVQLRRLCPDIKRGRRAISGRDRWVLYFPFLDTCREQFEKTVRSKINWGPDTEEIHNDASPF